MLNCFVRVLVEISGRLLPYTVESVGAAASVAVWGSLSSNSSASSMTKNLVKTSQQRWTILNIMQFPHFCCSIMAYNEPMFATSCSDAILSTIIQPDPDRFSFVACESDGFRKL